MAIPVKFQSRKFWVALVTEVVGVVTLFSSAAAGEMVGVIAGSVITILVALGYLKAEKDVDVARALK